MSVFQGQPFDIFVSHSSHVQVLCTTLKVKLWDDFLCRGAATLTLTYSSSILQSTFLSLPAADLLDSNAYWTATSAPQKTVSTVRNSASALGICQRWLADHCGEHRKIETIEPSALNPLLSRFITEVKRYGGRDYHPNSLISLRKCLDRHLRLNCYPCSIKVSPEFYNFQEAFKLRKAELELKLAQGVISPGVNRIHREDGRSGAVWATHPNYYGVDKAQFYMMTSDVRPSPVEQIIDGNVGSGFIWEGVTLLRRGIRIPTNTYI